MIVLVTLLAAIAVALAVYVVVLRRRLGMPGGRHDPPDTTQEAASNAPEAPMIVVEIKNVTEVAIQRTSLARPLATVAPSLLRSIVVRETVRQLRIQMAEEGLDAHVDVRHLAVMPPESEAPPADPTDA